MRTATSDLERRTALITGATAGIGYATALMLARFGAHVIITGRHAQAGERAAAAITQAGGRGSVTFLPADHATVGGNQDLAGRVRAATPRLNLLINNVGGLFATREETADGYEATLAMNFVGPYVLTAELTPVLRAGAPGSLPERGLRRIQDVEDRPVRRPALHRAVRQRRRVRPLKAAQCAGHPGVGAPPAV